MIEADIKRIVVYKARVDEWIGEPINDHSPVVDRDYLVYVNLRGCNLLVRPLLLASVEDSDSELTVIDVRGTIFITPCVLLDLLEFNVLPLFTTNFLFENQFLGI